MSKEYFEQPLLRHLPRSRGGTGPEHGTGFGPASSGINMRGNMAMDCNVGYDLNGHRDFAIKDNTAMACNLGINADCTENISIENFASIGNKVGLSGHDALNLTVLNSQINGRRLTDFTGDFDFLAVMSADEVLHLGEILHQVDFVDRIAVLKASKIGAFLQNRSFSDWVGLAGLLTGLASLAMQK